MIHAQGKRHFHGKIFPALNIIRVRACVDVVASYPSLFGEVSLTSVEIETNQRQRRKVSIDWAEIAVLRVRGVSPSQQKLCGRIVIKHREQSLATFALFPPPAGCAFSESIMKRVDVDSVR